MQCRGARFYYSYDRGRTWKGPYRLPKFGQKRIMARTDYLVFGPRECLVMLTAAKTNGDEGRPFSCLTTDGGATFEFRSWIGPEPKGFSIMPSTVRLAGGKLATAIRRKEGRMGFIDLYESGDEGRSWKHIAKPAKTGQHNGNPPSMILLADGRLCLTYGHRSRLRGIRARLSGDGGKTWGKEIMLRQDGRTWDLGYPRTVQRGDGKIVTIYYFTTEAHPEMHIAATIWKPQPAEK